MENNKMVFNLENGCKRVQELNLKNKDKKTNQGYVKPIFINLLTKEKE